MYGGNIRKISNRADWQQVVRILARTTREPIDLTTMQNIEIAVVHPAASGGGIGDGYATIGNNTGLRGSLQGGEITLVAPGSFEFWFKVDRMRALPPQVYDLGCVLTTDTSLVKQVLLCQVSIVEGFV